MPTTPWSPSAATDHLWRLLSVEGNCSGPRGTSRLSFVPLLDVVPRSSSTESQLTYRKGPNIQFLLPQ